MATKLENGDVPTAHAMPIEKGDVINVKYSKTRRGRHEFTAKVKDIREELPGIFKVKVSHPHRGKKYELTISRHGVEIATDYPDDADNQTIGTNAKINGV